MRLFKKLITAIVVVLIVLVIAVLVFVSVFDVNKYKPEIIAQVEQATGRNFSIDGNIGLTFYPWIGLKLEKTTLGNAAGFSNRPFASLDQLNVKVNVLPLLKEQVQINKIQLHGLKLSLEVDKQGHNNWSNLAAAGKSGIATNKSTTNAATGTKTKAKTKTSSSSTTAKPAAGFALKSLNIKGFEFVGATISYADKKTGMQASINDLNLETGSIQFDKPVEVKLTARVKNNQPVIASQISLTTALIFNQNFSLFDLRDLLLKVAVKANDIIKQDMTLSLTTQASVDMAKQQVLISQLKLSALDVNAQANIHITRFLDAPVIEGHVSVAPFDARAVSKKLGVVLPPMANNKALSAVSLASNLRLVKQKLELDGIKIQIDTSVLTGWVHVLNLAQQSVRYKLLLNQINLNDYLPPVAALTPDKKVATVPAKTAVTDAEEKIELPLALLRKLDVQGVFDINAMHIRTFDVSTLSTTTKAAQGLITVDPITLKALDGNINAGVSLNVKKQPGYKLHLKVKNVQAEPLVNPSLKGLMGEKPLHLKGAVNLTAAIATRGESITALKRQAKGKLTLVMNETKVTGFDPEYYVRSSIANYLQAKGLSSVASVRGDYKPRKVTVFNTISDTANINNGKVTTNNFLMDSERVTIKAHGEADIIKNSVDMISSIKLSRNKTVVEKLLKKPLFVHIYGPFEQLKYDVDTKRLSSNINSLVKAEAKAKLKKKLDAKKQQLQQKIDSKKKNLQDKLKNTLQNKLKGFF